MYDFFVVNVFHHTSWKTSQSCLGQNFERLGSQRHGSRVSSWFWLRRSRALPCCLHHPQYIIAVGYTQFFTILQESGKKSIWINLLSIAAVLFLSLASRSSNEYAGLNIFMFQLPYLTSGADRLLHLPSTKAVSARPNARPRM